MTINRFTYYCRNVGKCDLAYKSQGFYDEPWEGPTEVSPAFVQSSALVIEGGPSCIDLDLDERSSTNIDLDLTGDDESAREERWCVKCGAKLSVQKRHVHL